jgi:hypothetical protein
MADGSAGNDHPHECGHRLASLNSAIVSYGEASIWILRCTIAIVDLLALACVPPVRGWASRRGRTEH